MGKQDIGLTIIKVISMSFRIFLFAVFALVPIGFAFEMWDWIMGR